MDATLDEWLEETPIEPVFYTEEEIELTDSQKWHYYEHLFR